MLLARCNTAISSARSNLASWLKSNSGLLRVDSSSSPVIFSLLSSAITSDATFPPYLLTYSVHHAAISSMLQSQIAEFKPIAP